MLSQNPKAHALASLSFWLIIMIVFHVSLIQGDEENDSEGQNQFTGAFYVVHV